MGRRDEDDDAGNRPVSVDEQLVEACKAVDTATLVEIVQRFHKMQDDYDEALEQLGISARQLSQSRAEWALLSRQLGTASADVEAHKRQFRLQMAKTKRYAVLFNYFKYLWFQSDMFAFTITYTDTHANT